MCKGAVHAELPLQPPNLAAGLADGFASSALKGWAAKALAATEAALLGEGGASDQLQDLAAALHLLLACNEALYIAHDTGFEACSVHLPLSVCTPSPLITLNTA